MYGWGGGLLSYGMQNMQMPQNPNRNWGANPQKNQWIAGVTGYDGDFGGGGFQNWGPSNGYDIGTLERLYSQHSQMGQQPTSWSPTPQQGGWGAMPALQGLLGGLVAGSTAGPRYAAPVGGYAATSQPGFAGTFPPANSGSNMLWTV